ERSQLRAFPLDVPVVRADGVARVLRERLTEPPRRVQAQEVHGGIPELVILGSVALAEDRDEEWHGVLSDVLQLLLRRDASRGGRAATPERPVEEPPNVLLLEQEARIEQYGFVEIELLAKCAKGFLRLLALRVLRDVGGLLRSGAPWSEIQDGENHERDPE